MDEINNRGRAGLDDAADEAGRALHRGADRAEQRGREFADDAAETARDVRDRVSAGAREFKGHASDAYDDARDWASDSADRLRDGPSAVESFVKENPLLVGVVGLAAGLLLGALLPRTRQEDKAVGEWADEVRDQGYRYAREITNRGREFVETALDPDTLGEAAKRAGSADGGRGDHPARNA